MRWNYLNKCHPVMALLIIMPSGAQAAPVSSPLSLDTLSQRLDILWMLVAAALVFAMQIGFLLLEAGMVRSKNSINVAQKNILDFVISALAFACVGFMIAFGGTGVHWVDFNLDFLFLSKLDSWTIAFFVFQVMFCGTAATIVAGAVAERMKLRAYLFGTIFLSGLIYPVFVHWSWGNALGESAGAFLANMNFVDFAGSTVVHATGAWVALAACLVLGPRLGRFAADGTPTRIGGHNPVLAAAGAFLLYFGWIGFNGGSTTAVVPEIASIVANTLLAGAAGAFGGGVLERLNDRVMLPEKSICGLLGGLVAVTAGCFVLTGVGAIVIGLLGGTVAVLGNRMLEKLKIDDAVGAIGVHGFAGVIGTLGLVFLAPVDNLPLPNRWEQFNVQLLGVLINFVWAFGLGFAFFKIINWVCPIRVSARDEETGLNQAEHDTRLGLGHVEDAVSSLFLGTKGLETRLEVEPGDEAEGLSRSFNALLSKLEAEETARSHTLETQRSKEEAVRLAALLETTFEGICICVDGRIVDLNNVFATLLGLKKNEIKGRELAAWLDDDRDEILSDLVKNTENARREIEILSAQGQKIPIELRARTIHYRGASATLFVFIDLRDRKKAEAEIRFLAQHDPLTNLPNRAVFNERLKAMVERTALTGTSSAVILVDLDHFKNINDLYGHPAGDAVLKTTAERLRSCVRDEDVVARLGGDEFAILQQCVDFQGQAHDLALRLLDELANPVDVGRGTRVSPTASVGVAVCPPEGFSDEELVMQADTALYHAKKAGRNRCSVFELGMDAEIRRRQSLEIDMSTALDENQFELYFQPRMDISENRIKSYEALIRWNHPTKGLISPADFIPVAESSGQIVKIGTWVLETACRIAATHFSGRNVSVNVSPLQFTHDKFLQTLENALKNSALSPDRLEIEITENVLIDDDQRANFLLDGVKALGVQVALDDFGTGYSSLSYLSRFPFDTIKIDQSFVRNLKNDDESVAIVDTIIRLGRALNMTLVAEGVETEAELQLLRERGCHEIQGYFIGRPAALPQLQTELPAAVNALWNSNQNKHSAISTRQGETGRG